MIETRFPHAIRVQVSKGSRWSVDLDLASGDDTWVRAQLTAAEAKELARTLVAHAEELERMQGFEAMMEGNEAAEKAKSAVYTYLSRKFMVGHSNPEQAEAEREVEDFLKEKP